MIDEQDILVIGSQAILGSYNDAGLPADVTLSIEADRIHGALGELFAFHESFGIYGDGVTAATAALPAGWRDRLVPLTESPGSGAIGWCIDVHDLCAAKLYAGRPKDFRFVEAALRDRLVDVTTSARWRPRCVVVSARTRRSNSARSSTLNTSGSTVHILNPPRPRRRQSHHFNELMRGCTNDPIASGCGEHRERLAAPARRSRAMPLRDEAAGRCWYRSSE